MRPTRCTVAYQSTGANLWSASESSGVFMVFLRLPQVGTVRRSAFSEIAFRKAERFDFAECVHARLAVTRMRSRISLLVRTIDVATQRLLRVVDAGNMVPSVSLGEDSNCGGSHGQIGLNKPAAGNRP